MILFFRKNNYIVVFLLFFALLGIFIFNPTISVSGINFVDFEEDTEILLAGWEEQDAYYIAAGSKAEYAEWIGNTLNVGGIPVGHFFLLKTDLHTTVKITPLNEPANITIYAKDVTADGYITKFSIETIGNIDYEVGTFLKNMSHVVNFNGNSIEGSPFDSGIEGIINFTIGGSGQVSVDNFSGIIFEEDVLLELDNLN